MNKMVVFQENILPVAPVKLKFTVSQLQSLLTMIINGCFYPTDKLEQNAVTDIVRKLYFKLQRRVFMPGRTTRITFSDPEIWALSLLIGSIPDDSYVRQNLYELIDTIIKRVL